MTDTANPSPAAIPAVPTLLQRITRALAQKALVFAVGWLAASLKLDTSTQATLINVGLTVAGAGLSLLWTWAQENKDVERLESAFNTPAPNPPVKLK